MHDETDETIIRIVSGRARDLAKLRRLLIEFERALPVGVVERWQSTAEQPPFRNGKPAFGEPRDAAHDHHREDHRSDEKQQIGQSERARPAFSAGGRGGGNS